MSFEVFLRHLQPKSYEAWRYFRFAGRPAPTADDYFAVLDAFAAANGAVPVAPGAAIVCGRIDRG